MEKKPDKKQIDVPSESMLLSCSRTSKEIKIREDEEKREND
jgi:hypothetical protein